MRSKKSEQPNYRVNINQAAEAYLSTKQKQLGSPASFVRYSEIIVHFKRYIVEKCSELIYMDEISILFINEAEKLNLMNASRYQSYCEGIVK